MGMGRGKAPRCGEEWARGGGCPAWLCVAVAIVEGGG
jgi:hypothetical protein